MWNTEKLVTYIVLFEIYGSSYGSSYIYVLGAKSSICICLIEASCSEPFSYYLFSTKIVKTHLPYYVCNCLFQGPQLMCDMEQCFPISYLSIWIDSKLVCMCSVMMNNWYTLKGQLKNLSGKTLLVSAKQRRYFFVVGWARFLLTGGGWVGGGHTFIMCPEVSKVTHVQSWFQFQV